MIIIITTDGNHFQEINSIKSKNMEFNPSKEKVRHC